MEKSQIFYFEIKKSDAGKRLDLFIKEKLKNISRNRIQNLIDQQMIKVNEKAVKPGYKIKKQDQIIVIIPPEKELEIKPKDVPFDIIYEDSDIAIINKPSGIVVHPAPGHYEDTLVHGLLLKLKNLSGIGGKIRPGIVHRLDKDTSGIMLIAKNDFAHRFLVDSFKQRKIHKIYLTVVYKKLENKKGKIETFIGRHPVNRKKMAVLKEGKLAITYFEVKNFLNKATLVEAQPITGRTHQIRVHFSYIGHPVLGDPIYGGLKHDLPKPPRLMLHAYKISFIHPRTLKELQFIAPIPEEFEDYINMLQS